VADLSVLHQEPRHRVEQFVDEMLTRSRDVVAVMGPEFERLLRNMLDQFDAFRTAHYLITFKDVRFGQIVWLQETGQLLLAFVLAPKPHDPDVPRHAVVDAFVRGVVGRTVPDEFRDECEGFLRSMVMQFAMLKKTHSQIDLDAIAFATPTWVSDRELRIDITHHGKPFLPREARI
jgi:hypothetical protein